MRLYLAYLLKFPTNISDTNINASTNNNTTDNDTLILTPLIKKGKIDEARRQALVHHEEMQDVESYAGYFTVNKTHNSNMFFWYFPAQVLIIIFVILMLHVYFRHKIRSRYCQFFIEKSEKRSRTTIPERWSRSLIPHNRIL